MVCPDSMKASIRKLESTREARMQQDIPLLSLEEKDQLLGDFHPDYRPGSHRELPVGINRGERVVSELVNLLEAKSLIEPDDLDLNDTFLTVDVLILGGGGAGLTAALYSHDAGATADGLVIAYRAGAKFGFMDSIQFHPTATAYPELLLGALVTEVVRSRGAHLVNADGE